MRATRTEQQGEGQEVAPQIDAEAGTEQQTQFTAQGTIPPVGAAPAEAPAQEAPSASDLAFGGGGGGGRATSAAGGGDNGGKPLPDELKQKFEGALGADLSGVRVHTDGDAATAAGAKAVAHGQDIHVAPGQYDPHSPQGQELLAHEVAHTVQQKDAAPRPQAKGEQPAPANSPAEHDADRAASSMVAGQPAAVQPVAAQQPHAKEYSRAELIQAYTTSLNKQDWADVALRLNGFSDDDIAMLVGKQSGGQHAHVREAAEVAMPGWSQRVTSAIDAADANAGKIATLYAAYEKAVAGAKTSGDWHEVIDRLNGMGDWDIQDRLKKLTWFDYEAMRAQTDNKRVLDALDKADIARVGRINAAYHEALAAQDWPRVANQLHGMSDEDIRGKLDDLASKPETVTSLKRIKEAAPKDVRLTTIIDEVAQAHGEVVPDPLVVTPLAVIPDISDDERELKSIELANFAGNPKIAKFADELATAYGAQYAKNTHSDKKKPADATAKLAQLTKSFEDTAKHYVTMGFYKTVAQFGRRWMSEMDERADWDSGAEIFVATPKKTDSDQMSPDKLVHIAAPGTNPDGKQLVHPFVNEFMAKLGGGFTASTYAHHGESKSKDGTYPGDWAPLCLDVMPKIATDARGLYEPNQMMDFIERINAAAGGTSNWSGIYNDTTVARAMATRGLANKIDSTAQDGTHNFHGALNPHIHLYLRSPDGWAPGDPGSAPKVDPSTEPH
ncbi:MAG: DUF4157 domain-containing protein [Deltaproteobacteria bacterium]